MAVAPCRLPPPFVTNARLSFAYVIAADLIGSHSALRTFAVNTSVYTTKHELDVWAFYLLLVDCPFPEFDRVKLLYLGEYPLVVSFSSIACIGACRYKQVLNS